MAKSRGVIAVVASLCVVAAVGLVAFGRGGRMVELDEAGHDDYRDLLGREKQVLNSGGGGIDWGNQRFLANAGKEQDAYVANKNAKAAEEAREGMQHAAKLYSRWHDPYKNSQYAKYDTEKLPVYSDEARTQALAEQQPGARTSQEAAFAKVRAKAVSSCKGDEACEQVLSQVMGLFGRK